MFSEERSMQWPRRLVISGVRVYRELATAKSLASRAAGEHDCWPAEIWQVPVFRHNVGGTGERMVRLYYVPWPGAGLHPRSIPKSYPAYRRLAARYCWETV